MQVKKNVLNEKHLSEFNNAIGSVFQEAMWAISHNIWTPDISEKQFGTVAVCPLDNFEDEEKFLGYIAPHLPPHSKLSAYLNLWYPYSGIAWHNDAGYKFGATLYLNEKWDKNAGGYFLWEEKDTENIHAVCPSYNTLVVNDNHEMHCVTTVNPSIPEPRVTLQVWGHT